MNRPTFSVIGFLPHQHLEEYGNLDEDIPEEAERIAELEELARDAYDAICEDRHED